MALFAELFLALVISGLVALLFAIGFERVGPLGIVWSFVLLFFGTWALGAWTEPLGPQIWGVHWMPYLIAAVIIGMALAVCTPMGPPSKIGADEPEGIKTGVLAVALVVGCWIALLVAISALVLRYFGPAAPA